MNLKFDYLYRDGANYKNCGSMILTGCPENLSEFQAKLRETMENGEYFIASQVGVPEVFLYIGEYNVDDDDHSWHEFSGLTETGEEPTSQTTPDEFLQKFQKAQTEGWKEFEPREHPEANLKEHKDKNDSSKGILDHLLYASYRHNRVIAPDVSPERWAKIYGPMAAQMEERFQAEKSAFQQPLPA
jgi:hypothetical protein